METLDRIMELQSQGMQDAEITKTLSDEGISPREINDALNQARVKTAVSQDPYAQQSQDSSQQPQDLNPRNSQDPFQSQPQQSQTPEMQQSIMQPQEIQMPQAQESYPQQMQQYPQAYPQEAYYAETPQAYPQEAYYEQQPSLNTDVITDIAEQIVMEKIEEFEKKTGDLVSFKSRVNEKIDDLNDRLKKIESSIDKLQQAVIGKIGEFSETSSYIHKDLNNLHDTVSKLMNPLIDNYKELKKIAAKK